MGVRRVRREKETRGERSGEERQRWRRQTAEKDGSGEGSGGRRKKGVEGSGWGDSKGKALRKNKLRTTRPH